MPALLAVLLSVAACSSGGDTVRTASSPPPVSPPAAVTELVVEATAGSGSAPVRATLICDPPGGDHPAAEQACADLAAQPSPLAPLPADLGCTEQYGGPQTAVVRGTYRGEPVELELSRTNGCRIAQWDALGVLLSALVPAAGA